MHVSVTVNGRVVGGDVDARTLLVHFLRENLNLTGTHIGCESSYCGACTVLVNGVSTKSCTMLAVQAEGATITTIEGLAQNGDLHPVQEGFWERHGLQCGFCTPGMIMSAVGLLEGNNNPTTNRRMMTKPRIGRSRRRPDAMTSDTGAAVIAMGAGD